MIPSKRIVVREHACLTLSKDANVAAANVSDPFVMVAACQVVRWCVVAVCLEYAQTLLIAKKLEKRAACKP